MGNKTTSKHFGARRAATFLAALGALVMSSGVALMATATPANAVDHGPDPKIVVCKYVSTPGESGLQGGGNPIEVSLNSLKSVVSDAWLADPTFPKDWSDGQGQATGGSIAIGFAGQGLGISDCPGYQQEVAFDATAAVSVTDPACANENTPSYDISGSHVTWTVLDQDVSPGGFVTVKFTADAGHAFDDESTQMTITKHFGPAAQDCGSVQPTATTAGVTFVDPTCASAASYQPNGGPGVSYAVTSGSVAAGSPVTVTATAQSGYTITGTTAFSHTFTTPSGCNTVVSPPTTTATEGTVVVSTPKTHTKAKAHNAVTPTVVEAGLSSATTDLRGEQGLALMFAGMVMLVAAGGLGLRVRVAARI